MFGFFDMGYSAFSMLFFLTFIVILCVILVTAIRGAVQWNNNNHSPRLTVPARVVSKRQEHHHYQNNDVPASSSTYYVTFQVESGDRVELRVRGWEYSQLVEGDFGNLTFQGTRYLGFERH